MSFRYRERDVLTVFFKAVVDRVYRCYQSSSLMIELNTLSYETTRGSNIRVSFGSPAGMFTIESVQSRHEAAFIASARRSARLHHPWIAPPRTRAGFRQHLARYRADNQASYVAIAEADGSLIGCVHLNEIVHGALESAFMAYFAFVPFDGRGWMTPILSEVVNLAFHRHGLHRIEVNIQPANHRSKAPVQRLGFRLEGFSPRYLKIAGAWRDHERYALTVEEWRDR